MNRTRWTAVAAALSLALMSAPALAYPSADTVLVSGYDVESSAVLFGVSAIDQEGTDDLSLDCRLSGEFTYEVGAEDTDDSDDFETYEVTTLEDADGQVAFSYEDVNTESDVYDAALAVLYGTDSSDGVVGSEECELASVTIEANGEGEVNHGTIVSTFAHLLGSGQGCLVKLFAQSEFGKTDYVDDEAAEAMTVLLESAETACVKGKPATTGGPDGDSSNGEGRPAWAGQKGGPDKSDKAGNGGGKPPWAGEKGGPQG